MDMYIAHKKDNGETQSLLSHLEETAKLAARYSAEFNAEEWGRLCGLAHDIGKYSKEFQRRIRGEKIRADHSTAGSIEAFNQGAIPAAFCVAGHHGGLPDGGAKRDEPSDSTLFSRVKRKAPHNIPNYDAWKTELNLPPTPASAKMDNIEGAFFTRMLYSCLTDADYLDTEAFFSETPVPRGNIAPLSDLLEKLNAYFEAEKFFSPKNELNRHRADILRACINGASGDKGLYSLTVPTGGGKTFASLAFALHHAVIHGMRRVIYVIPYCSIIDQTAKIFRDIFGAENVLEHHSGIVFETDEDATLNQRKLAWAAENWDAPIIVTTAVQFFESLYANKSSKCRKLHNIANSAVVFDEAQMLPVPCLLPCVSAIGQLVQRYNVTALLCTATQPALTGVFQKLGHNLTQKELCPTTESGHPIFKRVRFKTAGLIGNAELAERLNREKQVLCIVNSRRQAQELYGLLTGEGNIHLSTLMYPAHRSRLLEEMRRRLCDGLPCRVVSTSLIEAGVDVDFPTVYRAEAGLDSLLQAAGRCNREGKRPADESIVTLFKAERPAPLMLGANVGALRETLRKYSQPDTPDAISMYFNTLLDLKGDSLDKHGVIDAFRNGFEGRTLPFESMAKRFRMLDDHSLTVYIPLEDGEGLINDIKAFGGSRSVMRRLGRYGVTVYQQHFNALYRAGDISMVAEGVPVLTNVKLYSKETGLSLEAEEGKAVFIA